jgi:hypothetical protein
VRGFAKLAEALAERKVEKARRLKIVKGGADPSPARAARTEAADALAAKIVLVIDGLEARGVLKSMKCFVKLDNDLLRLSRGICLVPAIFSQKFFCLEQAERKGGSEEMDPNHLCHFLGPSWVPPSPRAPQAPSG